MFKNVVLGISGGVDSAVALIFLKKKGFNVTACFMKNWDIVDEIGHCSSEKDYQDAKWVCEKLKVPLVQVNFVKDYWNDVFSYTIESYVNRETPNPDIQCNKNIKFNKFYQFARTELQADAIATGHYACTSFGPYLENFEENKNARLLVARDPRKDQTFFLSQVKQESLRRCMFPLGNYFKSDIKRIALHNNLKPIVEKRESMGICFIGKRNFKDFISEYVENKPGNFIDIETGKVVGTHEGQHMWTLGQRTRTFPICYFVCDKDPKSSDMFVVNDKDHPIMYTDMMFTSEPHWIVKEPQQLQNGNVFECLFRFQHLKPCVKAKVYKCKDRLIILLETPLRALTPGQYAVFYHQNECLGSAKITKLGPSDWSLSPIESEKIDQDDDERIPMTV